MDFGHATDDTTMPAGADLHGAIARLARNASIETSTHNVADVGGYAQVLAPGTDVYVTFLPGTPYHHILSTAARLRQVGLNPVPHLAARRFASAAAVADFVARLRDEAGVGRVLLIAGDSDAAAEVSLEQLQEGLLAPRLPGVLAASGVKVAFVTLGMKDPRRFSANLAAIVRAGFPPEAALAALTTTPAALLGLSRSLGTLEPGKQANLMVVEGDLFTDKPVIRQLFIAGHRQEIKPPPPGGGPAANGSGGRRPAGAEPGAPRP